MVTSLIFIICLLIYAGVAGFVILSPFIIAFIIWFIKTSIKALNEEEEQRKKRREYIENIKASVNKKNGE